MSSTLRLPALMLVLLASSTAHADDTPDKWGAWIDGGAFYRNKDQSRGESTLWAPLWQSPTSVFFFEGQGKIFEESQKEGNFALAWREMLASGWNLGAWGGYDIRSTTFGSRFSQVAGGVEALSTNWDFRLNGYVPLNDSEVVSEQSQFAGGTPTIVLNGPSILMQTGVISQTSQMSELAFGGVDAEVGLRLPVEALSIDPQAIDLRIYGGGFYFENPAADQSISGPKARAELRINDLVGAGSRLTLEAAFSSDDIRGELFETGARLRIPLGEQRALASLSIQSQRMSEGLRRDTDIVSSTKTTSTNVNTLTTEAVQDAATNVDINKVAYVDPGTAGGITGVATAQGANTLIIANGAFNANSVLQSAQTLMGGGSTITLLGKTTGTQVQFTASGPAATITGQSGGYALITNSDVHVTGLTIDATAATGGIAIAPLFAANTAFHNIVIDHNTISAASHDAIVAGANGANSTASDIRITDNVISAALNGINVFKASDVEISNNQMYGLTNTGVIAQTATTDLAIIGNAITTVGNATGILLSGDDMTGVAVVGNTISSTGPITISGDNGDGIIAGNTLDPQNATAITKTGDNNTYHGGNNILQNGTACAGSGTNPGMNVTFTNGAHCP